MNLRTGFAILGLALLAACSSDKPIPIGAPVALNFRDADPVDFKGQHPARYRVQGIDAARFQTQIDWGTARRNGVSFAFLKATGVARVRQASRAVPITSIISARHQRCRHVGSSAMFRAQKGCCPPSLIWNGIHSRRPVHTGALMRGWYKTK